MERKAKTAEQQWQDWLDWLDLAHSIGAADAEKGVYNIPYFGSEDPEDMDINEAYHSGFSERRKELGDLFEWE